MRRQLLELSRQTAAAAAAALHCHSQPYQHSKPVSNNIFIPSECACYISIKQKELPFHPNMDTSDLLHRSIWLYPAVPSQEGSVHQFIRNPEFHLSFFWWSWFRVTEIADQLSHSREEYPNNQPPNYSPCWHSRNTCSSSLSAQATSCAASGNRKFKFLYSAALMTQKEMAGWSESIPQLFSWLSLLLTC